MTGKASPLGAYFASWSDRAAHGFVVLIAVVLSITQLYRIPAYDGLTTFLFASCVLTWIAAIIAVSRLWVVPVTAIEHGGIRRPFAVTHRRLSWGDIADVRAKRTITKRSVIVQLRDGGRVTLNRVPHSAVPALRSYIGVDGDQPKRGSWWLVGYAISGSAGSAPKPSITSPG